MRDGYVAVIFIIYGPVNKSQVLRYMVGTVYAGFC